MAKRLLSQDDLKQQLKSKYEAMDEKQLQALMAQKLVQIGKEEEKMRLITESIKQSTEQLVHYQKVLLGLLIAAIVLFVLYIGLKLGQVYLSFRKFIAWVNTATISPTTWPTGGFGTALCIVYPFMTSWMGFNDDYLPMAAYMTWFQYGTSVLANGQTVNDSAQTCLTAMFQFAQLGGYANNSNTQCSGLSGNDVPVWEIICCGWGNANGIDVCQASYCDTSFSTSDWVNAGTSAMGQGISGAFAGSMAGGPVGMGIGFVAMAGVQFGLSYWQTQSQKQANADANGCNGTAGTTPQ